VSRDWRDDRIAELEAEVAELRQTNEKLLARIAALEARLNQSSANSSQPPSKDSPKQRRERKRKRKSGRKRGGQPGHKPHQRELVPPEKVTATVDHRPDQCDGCGAVLTEVDDTEPLRHQIIELPEIIPDVTEHRLHACDCPSCGHRTRAKLPPDVPASMWGPRLQALVGLLTGSYRVSRRGVVSLLSDVLSIRVSLGALSKAEERVSEAIAPAVDEAVDFAQAQPIKHCDATSWSNGGIARTLWTLSTAMVTVFAITVDGSRSAARVLLDRVRGILVSDRATVFLFWAMSRRQICWAHLLRKFLGCAQRGGPGAQLARELQSTTELMFHYWHRVRDGTMSRAEFRRWTFTVRERFEWLLERGAARSAPGFSGVCKNILEHKDALWNFVEHRGLDPTNNQAERDLRPGVQWRKTSYGSQSERGERYAERIMTVTHTLRKQQRPVFEYLYHACLNSQNGRSPPSLLPT